MPVSALPSILDLTKQLVRAAVGSGATVIDATVGNGHDTLFLAELVGPSGRVFGFDVQESALMHARERLATAGVAERVTLIHAGHHTLLHSLPAACIGTVRAAMFNLGYLPGSDKQVVTVPETTIAALDAVLGVLAPGGIVTVHVYTGHAGGMEEALRVQQWCDALDWAAFRAIRYGWCNKERNSEALVVVERLQGSTVHERKQETVDA